MGTDWNVSLSVIRPELALAVTALTCIGCDLIWEQKDKVACWIVTFLGIATALTLTVLSWGTQQEPAFGGLVLSDNMASFFAVIFLVAGGIALLQSMGFVRREGMMAGEYCTLILVCLIGMMFMARANDLMILYLGLETMSIPIYVLAGMLTYRQPKSPEAAIKYLLLGAFASALLLFGIALVYGSLGTTGLTEVLRYATLKRTAASPLFVAGAAFLLAGMAFKVSLVPFHMWTPDVYEGAPTSVTAFMSTAVKAAGFTILIRVIVIAMNPLAESWSEAFWWLAVVTMVLGNVVALAQENIKRMLAYSSIAHAGYVLVALTAGTRQGVEASLFYLFVYAMMNLGAFGVVISVGRKGDTGVAISDFAGLGRRHPLYAMAMAVFMFSLAGIPPTAGFVGKFYAFSAAIKSGYVTLAIIGVLMSAVSAYFYLRILVVMYFQEAPESAADASTETQPSLSLGWGVPVSLVACSLFVLWFGIRPELLSFYTMEAVEGVRSLM